MATLRIDLKADFSGTVTASSLLVVAEPVPLERKSAGATWRDRVNLSCAHGSFASLAELRVAGITFARVSDHALRVTVPRGEPAAWPAAFTPARDERARAARAFDPGNRMRDVGTSLTIEVTVPSEVIAHGVRPRARGLGSDAERNRATLTVPVESVGTEPFVWDVTW